MSSAHISKVATVPASAHTFCFPTLLLQHNGKLCEGCFAFCQREVCSNPVENQNCFLFLLLLFVLCNDPREQLIRGVIMTSFGFTTRPNPCRFPSKWLCSTQLHPYRNDRPGSQMLPSPKPRLRRRSVVKLVLPRVRNVILDPAIQHMAAPEGTSTFM